MGSPVRAAIYARISSDSEGQGLGVQRQIEDCTAEAQRRGWGIARTYTDNDVSATRSKVRPEYQRMLTDVRAGVITGLIVWDVDRLTRTPRELEDIIDLADKLGLALASVGGEIDLATPQGRMTARIKGSVARHETEQQSRRLKRKFQERAEAGQPHSFAAYGYRRISEFNDLGHRVNTRDELHPEQAEVIREAARMLLSGQSLRSVVAELNSRGSTSPRGNRWASTNLRQIMLRDRNAGQRRHRGQVIGLGQWPSIYEDANTHDRVVALLTDPSRKSGKGTTRKHLLAGIARCGREGCDGKMIVNVGRVAADGGRQPPAYVCGTCTRVRRKQSSVDELVESVIVERLKMPDVLDALAAGNPADAQRARAHLGTLQARLELAADQYADGDITGAQLTRITAKLRPQIDAATMTIRAAEPSADISKMVGDEAEKRWQEASLDIRRLVVETLCSVSISPSGPGKAFDPTLIEIRWHGVD